MTAVWTAAFAILAAAVVLLALFVLGVSSRVLRILYSVETKLRITTASNVLGSHSLAGSRAPQLLLDATVNGHGEVAAGWAAIVFLDAGCEPCNVLATDLTARRTTFDGLTTVAIVDDARAFNHMSKVKGMEGSRGFRQSNNDCLSNFRYSDGLRYRP